MAWLMALDIRLDSWLIAGLAAVYSLQFLIARKSVTFYTLHK